MRTSRSVFYGLSYTTFTQEVTNKAALQAASLEANEKFTVDIKVTNTGTKAGKQVVQLYASAPYENEGIDLLLSIFLSIRGLSNESVLHVR